MDYNRLRNLLDRYWEGKTDLEEEKELSLLLNESTDEELKQEREYFQFLSGERTISSGKNHRKETATKRHVVRGKTRKLIWNSMKLAASISIIVVAGYVLLKDMGENEDQLTEFTDTFEDPQKAFQETKKALKLISENIGKGRKEASKLGAFGEVESKLKGEKEEIKILN